MPCVKRQGRLYLDHACRFAVLHFRPRFSISPEVLRLAASRMLKLLFDRFQYVVPPVLCRAEGFPGYPCFV